MLKITTLRLNLQKSKGYLKKKDIILLFFFLKDQYKNLDKAKTRLYIINISRHKELEIPQIFPRVMLALYNENVNIFCEFCIKKIYKFFIIN